RDHSARYSLVRRGRDGDDGPRDGGGGGGGAAGGAGAGGGGGQLLLLAPGGHQWDPIVII
ncbi:MAG: hypothetical protein LQ351_007689, partial [Letrouitia transgressa]